MASSDAHTEVAQTFVSNFAIPLDDGITVDEFLSVYHPQIKWFDHAFHICRSGHAAILGLKKSFLHCNQPFKIDIKNSYATEAGAVVETIWIGCCKNDIVRPNGEVAVVGTGRDFKAHVCFILQIDDKNLITRIDEYYNRRWDEGIEEGSYFVMEGASLKE